MQGTRILVIDDDRDTRWALAAILRKEGAQVTEAGNGEEALRFLLRAPFDMIVTDVCMPGLGGFGLFAAIRFGEEPEVERLRSVPILFISGQVPIRDLASSLDAGVDDILEKPADPEEFKARVRAALRRARSASLPRARTRGDLADFGMAALSQALHLAARNVRLEVQNGAVGATIDFHNGEIRHAVYEEPGAEFRGDEGAVRALGMETGVFQLVPLPDSLKKNVFGDTSGLLLRAATRSDEITAKVR